MSAKILDDLILPEQILWTDRWDWQPVSQNVIRTLNGGQAIFTAPLAGGRPITLEARDGVAWFDRAQVDALQLKAALSGAVFQFQWLEESWEVMFRHHEPPAFSAAPLWPGNEELFTGIIRLMVV